MDGGEHKIMETACVRAFREAAARSFAPHEPNSVGCGPERNVGQVSAYAKRMRCWLRVVALALVFGRVSSVIAQPTPLPPNPPAPPIPIEQMRAFGYTKEFAKRFALPEPEPGWEPGEGLLAVEFRVEPIPGPRGLYGCDFKLYIDSRLDIAFPEPGLSGSSELYTSRTHPFIARGKGVPDIPQPDRRAYGERQRAFGQLAAIATSDYVMGKSGALISSSITEFVRDLFPGVNYVRAHDCTLALSLSVSERHTGINVWVKKSTGKDYSRTAARDPKDFYQFPLPSALIAEGRPWAEWVSQFNHFIFEAEAREQRARSAAAGAPAGSGAR